MVKHHLDEARAKLDFLKAEIIVHSIGIGLLVKLALTIQSHRKGILTWWLT